MRLFWICTASLALAACADYQWRLNDNVVYTPKPLFQDYARNDADLSTCLAASIKEQNIRAAEKLNELRCPEGSIADIDALSIFTELKKLGLANNRISNVEALGTLSELRQVDLSHNAIKDISPLVGLKELTLLDVRENNVLNCASAQGFSESIELRLPEHCQHVLSR